MSKKPRVAIVGLGNVGRFAVEAVQAAPDLELAGIVRRDPSDRHHIADHIDVVADIDELEDVHVALLCLPTRGIPERATYYLQKGICTVDSYDIHGELVTMRAELEKSAKQGKAAAIVSAGWDPGTNSIVRTLFELMAPRGQTFTNYGPGMSMGHSVAVRAIEGVVDGLSITVPLGQGIHRRMVYVVIDEQADFQEVKQRILCDPYFKNDETHVTQVRDVQSLIDMGHGVTIERKGVSGQTHNQIFTYDIRINNPAATSQVMVSAARAVLKQEPGAYTMLEVPLLDFLPGDRNELLKRLV